MSSSNEESRPTISRDEFKADYCRRSGLTPDELCALGRYVFPCECGADNCQGWQMRSTYEDYLDDVIWHRTGERPDPKRG